MKILRTAVAVAKWLALTLTAFFAGVAKVGVPPDWFPLAWAEFFPWVTRNQWVLLPGLPVLGVVLQWVLSRLDARTRQHRLRALLNELLSLLREEYVPTRLREQPAMWHRLTLFKANRRQTRLSIVARSGEATRGSKTRWRIHPDDQDRCEGVAGVGWFLDVVMVVPEQQGPGLPELSEDSDDSAICDYAKRTFVKLECVRERRWKARSFGTLPVRVDGRRWGVLVLDSVSPEGARLRRIQRLAFAADLLGDIIKAWRTR